MVAEDGTIKKYSVEITKLSAKIAELSNLALEGDSSLHPAFCTKVFEYNSEYSLSVKQEVVYEMYNSLFCFLFQLIHKSSRSITHVCKCMYKYATL